MSEALQEVNINIGKDFSRYPAGRLSADGPNSGEKFRDAFLRPHLEGGTRVVVDLDDTAGYGSSFLEEAFGGLIRSGIKPASVKSLLKLRSSDESLVLEINGYIDDEIERLKKE